MYIFSLVSDIELKNPWFLRRVKIPYQQLNFSQFHHGTIIRTYYTLVL